MNFALFCRRSWHQELLQEDRLWAGRIIYGEKAELMPLTRGTGILSSHRHVAGSKAEIMLSNPGKKAQEKEWKLKTEVCLLLSICYAATCCHKLKSLLGRTWWCSPERPPIVPCGGGSHERAINLISWHGTDGVGAIEMRRAVMFCWLKVLVLGVPSWTSCSRSISISIIMSLASCLKRGHGKLAVRWSWACRLFWKQKYCIMILCVSF